MADQQMLNPHFSKLRLNLIRLLYLIMAVGLAIVVWPSIIFHDVEQAHSGPASQSMLAAMGALAVVGLRYPLKMLPLLVFEILWKGIFLISFCLPLWLSGQTDAASWENIWSCALVAIFVPIMPWRYILSNYVTARGG